MADGQAQYREFSDRLNDLGKRLQEKVFIESTDESRNITYGQFSAGNYELQLPFGFESDQAVVLESLALLTQHVDLAEPFGRIHEAIREAQRIGGRTSEVHGQAA